MNTIKKISLSLLSILAFNSTYAQYTFKDPSALKLKNGMNVIISENSHSPKAYASFTLDDAAFDNRKDGVVELLNVMINENVGQNANISFNDNSGKLTVATTDFDKELSVMANIIQHASLDQKTFDTAKAKLMASLKAMTYDYDSSVNENSIAALTLSDLQNFYNQITPAKTYITIAGNVNTADAKASVKKAFANWTVTGNNTSAEVNAK